MGGEFGEPWTVIAVDDDLCEIYGHRRKACGGKAIPIKDAERIVACVNYCQDIPTEHLVAMHALRGRSDFEQTVACNNRTIEALKAAIHLLEHGQPDD